MYLFQCWAQKKYIKTVLMLNYYFLDWMKNYKRKVTEIGKRFPPNWQPDINNIIWVSVWKLQIYSLKILRYGQKVDKKS